MSKENSWESYIESRLQRGSENLSEDILKKMDLALLTYVATKSGGDINRMAAVLGITVDELKRKLEDLGRLG